METYRLKNIAIVILLLLNACLLFMVGPGTGWCCHVPHSCKYRRPGWWPGPRRPAGQRQWPALSGER